jgi:hypothetical protein
MDTTSRGKAAVMTELCSQDFHQSKSTVYQTFGGRRRVVHADLHTSSPLERNALPET